MKAFARVIVVVLALVALVVGFAGGTAALDITQAANKANTQQVEFEVKPGDTTTTVAQRLQDEGLIRSALVFRYFARYKHLDQGIEQGVYLLSPSMTMTEIITQLQSATPNEIVITLPDGYRATQYPPFFAKQLPNFKTADFLQIVKSGQLTDGTKLWTKYWFIENPANMPGYYDALEGYLYPAGYYFYPNSTASDVVEKMLTQFGVELCPGPNSNPTAYMGDAAKCRANAAQINGKNIFDLMRATYLYAKSDVEALHDMLIVASLTTREINDYSEAPGVAAVYHNRYLNIMDKYKYPSDTGQLFGSDPTVEYARDDEQPPSDGHWWKGLDGVRGSDVAPKDPYNTYNQAGLIPTPIANPYWGVMAAAITPPSSPYWYFVSNTCGKIIYGKTQADLYDVLVPAMSGGGCS